MNDAARLALRLHAVMGIVAVAHVACTRADPQNEQPKPEPTSTKTIASTTPTPTPTPDPTPTTPPDPPPTIGKPTGGGCSPIPWCGTIAQASVNKKAGSASRLSCATDLENADGAHTLPGYTGPYWSWATLDDKTTTEQRAAGKKDACCYDVSRLCGGGRPLLDHGAPIVASTRSGNAWSEETIAHAPIDLARDDRERLGEAWLRDALFEQASVASFARASMELLAVGAAPELVEECHRAALDEIRHARLCFAMARRYLQREIDPGPMPMPSPRPASIVDVARNTFVEGCVGETISALDAARRAESTNDPVAAGVLRVLARDEEAHAALAYKTIACCIAIGGRDVVEALGSIVDAPRGEMDETSRDAWRDVIAPTMRALLAIA